MTSGLGAVSHTEFAVRIAVALVLGSAIGLERQWRQRLAGLRTNALVAIGSCLFVEITPLLGPNPNATQIAAYVVSGIGFLAGGVIFKERFSVTGLNTAATIWCTAAVGSLAGYGFLIEAAIGVAAVLAANIVLRPIAHRINRQPLEGSEIVSSYEIRTACDREHEERVRASLIAAIKDSKLSVIAVYSDDAAPPNRVEVTADVSAVGPGEHQLEGVVMRVATEPGITSISWRAVPTTAEERDLVSDV